jgi:hypothetical protein
LALREPRDVEQNVAVLKTFDGVARWSDDGRGVVWGLPETY